MPFSIPAGTPISLVLLPVFLLTACGGGSSSSSSQGNKSDAPPVVNTKLILDYQENVAETLYYNSSTQGAPSFTYVPNFVFKNTSGESATIQSVEISDTTYLTGVSYQCNGQAGVLPCTLAANETLTVSGKLAGFSQTENTKALTLTLKDSNKQAIGEHKLSTLFVPYVEGNIAVRTVNLNTDANALYLAAAYQGNTLNFTQNSNQLYVGTLGNSAKFKTDDFAFPNKEGGVVYMPHGQSGTLYLSFDQFTGEATPNPNAPGTPGFFTAELTYLDQVPNPPAKCTASGVTCEQLTLDTTYVNFIQYFGSASTIGTSSYLPSSALTGYGYAGASQTAIEKGTKQVYKDIYQVYEGFDKPWKFDSSKTAMTDNYFATSTSGGTIPDDTSILFAPIQLFQADNQNNVPMGNDYYQTYVDALWNYLATNPIYVDANSITNPAKSNCVLKGQVNTGNQLLEFTPITGNDCPSYAYVVPAMVGQFSSCTGSQAPTVDGTNCADAPNLSFAKLNTCDFITAAGSADCGAQEITQSNFVNNETLWGPNGTFRAIVGRAMTSYQAAGLLPICSGSGMTPISQTSPMNQANSRAAIATGNAFENPSCLTGLDAKKPVYNVYTKEVGKYVQAYTYSYGDFLGMDATMTYSRNAFSGNDNGQTCATHPDSPFCQLPKALPITLKIH